MSTNSRRPLTSYPLVLTKFGFAYAASKLLHDIAVMASEHQNATPVALAALTPLCGMVMDDVHIHHLEAAVDDARELLAKLTPSVFTTSEDAYEEIRESLREQGHVGIFIALTRGLRPNLTRRHFLACNATPGDLFVLVSNSFLDEQIVANTWSKLEQ